MYHSYHSYMKEGLKWGLKQVDNAQTGGVKYQSEAGQNDGQGFQRFKTSATYCQLMA